MNIFRQLFDLRDGEDDKEKTLQNVNGGISFTGANLWILACAIIVASVGLNVNSTAVIIGAMLISPLMGPILGAGFALGTYDFDLLKRALRNLLIATVAALLVSTAYFYLSPFKTAQSEILARTSPNIYDILIAFFGGLVGVIAITRVEKGNPVPGVAIATALMPPLCTAGYGLATGQIRFFLGALFLYTINCVFICIATYLIVKLLRYPAKEVAEKRQKLVQYAITGLVILMLAPSGYFAWRLYDKQNFLQAIDKYIEREFTDRGVTVIYKKTSYESHPKRLELAFLQKHMSSEEIAAARQDMKAEGLDGTQLVIKQDSVDNIMTLKNSILNEINGKDAALDAKDMQIKSLEDKLAAATYDNGQLQKEIAAIFPGVRAISVANHPFAYAKDSVAVKPVLVYEAARPLSESDKLKLQKWLKERLNLKDLSVYKLQ
ncbi:MAG: DUF389 domain-containing protein [Bacteroidetes bacterium]|nr:DUF389 domain-containing protein [Bacteroidota bacterium]